MSMKQQEQTVDMDVVVTKVLSLVIITGITVIVGVLPCRMSKHFGKVMFRRKRVFDGMVSGAKCFSGGAFLGTCFLHLIPETRRKVDTVMEQIGSKYPLAELLTIAGFFGVTFGEHVIRYLYYKFQEDSCIPSLDDSYSLDNEFAHNIDDMDINDCELMECKSSRSSVSHHRCESPEITPAKDDERITVEDNSNYLNVSNPNNIHMNHLTTTQRDSRFDMEIEPAPLQELEVKTVVTEISKGEEGRGQIKSVFLLAALSFHGVFEGMALGLQAHESDVWVMCIAIAIHRGVLSFAISLQNVRNLEKASTILFTISAFSVICAVGIVIGIAISTGAQLYSDVDVANAILQSIATGTIFYIVFLNILFKELDGNKDVKKISCTFVGFAFIAVVLAVAKQ
ncbi:hypothetical protein ACF0H5_012784 [Mactra antiquata]